MDHVALRLLALVLSLAAVPLVLPAAAADGIDTPPVGVPSTTAPGCLLRVNSRIHVFCGTGVSAVCVTGVTCVGAAPNGACSQVTDVIVCVSKVTVGGEVVPGQTVGCYAYNEDALTNMCLDNGTQSQSAPSATLGSQRVCVVGGSFCNDVPVVQPSSQTVTVPTVVGYVELTVLCGVVPEPSPDPDPAECSWRIER